MFPLRFFVSWRIEDVEFACLFFIHSFILPISLSYVAISCVFTRDVCTRDLTNVFAIAKYDHRTIHTIINSSPILHVSCEFEFGLECVFFLIGIADAISVFGGYSCVLTFCWF